MLISQEYSHLSLSKSAMSSQELTYRRPADIDDQCRLFSRFPSSREVRQKARPPHRVGRTGRERLDGVFFGLSTSHEGAVVGGEEKGAGQVEREGGGAEASDGLGSEGEEGGVEDCRIFALEET